MVPLGPEERSGGGKGQGRERRGEMERLRAVRWYSRKGRQRTRPEGGSRQTPREEKTGEHRRVGKEGQKEGEEGEESSSEDKEGWVCR